MSLFLSLPMFLVLANTVIYIVKWITFPYLISIVLSRKVKKKKIVNVFPQQQFSVVKYVQCHIHTENDSGQRLRAPKQKVPKNNQEGSFFCLFVCFYKFLN